MTLATATLLLAMPPDEADEKHGHPGKNNCKKPAGKGCDLSDQPVFVSSDPEETQERKP